MESVPFLNKQRNQAPMKKILFVGLDVHKESIVVATAPQGDTAVELYGQIGGTLDALDKLIKKLQKPDQELRFV